MSDQPDNTDDLKPHPTETDPNNNQNPSSTDSETKPPEPNADSQNEQAELSEVETGNKGQPDFDEMITFNHTYLNYRIAKVFSEKSELDNATFDLLMTNVFIFSGKLIDVKSMSNLSNTEAVKNIRQKVLAYKDQDLNNKSNFIENIPFYVKTVGFQETVESVLPIIGDLPREKEELAKKFFKIFPKFVDEIVKFEEKGYFILNEYMINLLCEFLTNRKNAELLKSCSDDLVYITKYFPSFGL